MHCRKTTRTEHQKARTLHSSTPFRVMLVAENAKPRAPVRAPDEVPFCCRTLPMVWWRLMLSWRPRSMFRPWTTTRQSLG